MKKEGTGGRGDQLAAIDFYPHEATHQKSKNRQEVQQAVDLEKRNTGGMQDPRWMWSYKVLQ